MKYFANSHKAERNGYNGKNYGGRFGEIADMKNLTYRFTLIGSAALLFSSLCMAQGTVVETIEFDSQPYIQSGVAITDEKESATDEPGVVVETFETRRMGSNTVREYRASGRLLRTEVTPDVGFGTYVIENPREDFLSWPKNNQADRTGPLHKWVVQQW